HPLDLHSSLHDALPILGVRALATHPDVIGVKTRDVRHSNNQHAVAINVDIVRASSIPGEVHPLLPLHLVAARTERDLPRCRSRRSEEHTSELQSLAYLV